jgi:hypothetical protein
MECIFGLTDIGHAVIEMIVAMHSKEKWNNKVLLKIGIADLNRIRGREVHQI